MSSGKLTVLLLKIAIEIVDLPMKNGHWKWLVHSVATMMCEMCWDINSNNPCTFIRSNHESFDFVKLGHTLLMEEVVLDVHGFLVRQIPKRHDFHQAVQFCGIHLTRFLADSPFRSSEEFQFLEPYISLLPKDHQHVKALLQTLWGGRIFNGPRLKAAGLSSNEGCSCGAAREDSVHTFKICPHFAETRPSNSWPLTTWCTAIFPYKPKPVSTATYDFLSKK